MNLRSLTSVLAAAALLTASLATVAAPVGPRRAGPGSVESGVKSQDAARATKAIVLFSTFGKPTDAFQGGGFTVAGPANPYGFGKQFVAAPFVPAQSATLTGLAVAVNRPADLSTNISVIVKLYTDAGGIPGSVVKSWPAATVDDFLDNNFSYLAYALDSDSGISLTAGTTYWVAVETDAQSDFYGWWASSSLPKPKSKGTLAYWNDSAATWVTYTTTVPAMVVSGVVQ